MTEVEWMGCSDPEPLLKFLYGTTSERKLRLYLSAFIHQVPLLNGLTSWDNLEEECRLAVATAEAFADGVASSARLEASNIVARLARWEAEADMFGHWDGTTDPSCYFDDASHYDAAQVCEQLTKAVVRPRYRQSWSGRLWELVTLKKGEIEPKRTQDARYLLLRDIFGNPFRPIALGPTWLTPTVVNFAQAIYDDGTFDCLPSLADSLEEAGCTNADILNHCRNPGQHVRGCRVVDAVLGKE